MCIVSHLSKQEAASQSATASNGLLKGHLVTIESEGENEFVTKLLQAHHSKAVWIGGLSDSDKWSWVVGPEPNRGFWLGGFNGTAINGAYTNWHANEPNT